MTMVRVVLALAAGAIFAASCASTGGSIQGGRYVDPFTCEVRNPKPGDNPFDADCLKAAQASAEAAAKASKRK
jgi:hypothetical protein